MPKKTKKKNSQKTTNNRLIWLEVVLAVLIFVVGIVYVNETAKHSTPTEKINKTVAQKNLQGKEKVKFERVEIPTPPTTLPRLGKDGAILTAYFFADYESASEQKFYTEILPKIKKYVDDGTLKIYWVAREGENAQSVQSAMATKCTQKYSDEFFWKYLDEFYARELPLDYYGLLSVTRDISLNEYYFAKCVLYDYYEESVQGEIDFAKSLDIKSPTFILDGVIFTDFEAEKIVQTIEILTAPEDVTDVEDYVASEENQNSKMLHEPTWGNPAAEIQVVEFCDFGSEACQALQPAIAHLQEKYRDEVQLKFYNLPMSEESKFLAESAECAHEQGVFWNYHNWLFVNQGEVDRNNLAHAVLGLGIQPRALELCLQEKRYQAEVENDVQIAKRLKIETVPTLCVDTDCLEGTLTVEDIEQIIQLKLNRN